MFFSGISSDKCKRCVEPVKTLSSLGINLSPRVDKNLTREDEPVITISPTDVKQNTGILKTVRMSSMQKDPQIISLSDNSKECHRNPNAKRTNSRTVVTSGDVFVIDSHKPESSIARYSAVSTALTSSSVAEQSPGAETADNDLDPVRANAQVQLTDCDDSKVIGCAKIESTIDVKGETVTEGSRVDEEGQSNNQSGAVYILLACNLN